MVVCIHSKMLLREGCKILALISTKNHYGCAESCLMNDIGLLRWGVSQGSLEADMMKLAYFLWLFFLHGNVIEGNKYGRIN